jgi:WG containing repeat
VILLRAAEGHLNRRRFGAQARWAYNGAVFEVKKEIRVEMEVLMNPLPRQAISLLLFTVCLGSWPAQAADERTGGPLSAQSVPADNLATLSQEPQPSQAAGPQSSADDTGALFPVGAHGKSGYIDKTGKVVIPLQFYRAYPFHEGMAFVQMYQDLANPRRLELQPIDKTGKVILGQEYSYAGPFAEGMALVEVPWSHSFFHIDKGGLGYIDKTGKMVIPLQGFEIASSFTEGLAAVKDHGKWGYIDKTGKMVISPQFSGAHGFSEGLAEVEDNKKWGYIDTTGKMVIPPQYEVAYKHSEGLAAVKDGGRWGYIDKTGKMVIPPRFSDAYGFSEGLAGVQDGKKWGYIDKAGKMVIAPQFDVAWRHSGGLAAVKTDGKWGYVDATGNMVIPARFDDAGTFADGLAAVRQGKEGGYIDNTGKCVWGPIK